MKSRIAVVTDFDGTISCQDVQVAILDAFGRADWRRVEAEILAAGGKSQAYLPRSYEGFGATTEEVKDFVRENAVVDPGFHAFASFCLASGIPLEVASDGLELYIRLLLGEELYAQLPVACNRADLERRPVRFEFRFASQECGRCATCKRNRVARLQDQGYHVVYVGDGISDECPARVADEVWAKGHLLAWCGEKGIVCREFHGFTDLTRVLAKRLEDPADGSAGSCG